MNASLRPAKTEATGKYLLPDSAGTDSAAEGRESRSSNQKLIDWRLGWCFGQLAEVQCGW